jgi:hypothetical protein
MVIKSLVPNVDFLTKDGLQWLSENLFTDVVEIHVGKKNYDAERKESIFDLITQGAILSDGQLYVQINTIIQS